MIAVLPFYGAGRIVHSVLGILREYGVIAMRILGELFIVIVGSLILLPTLGVIGAGIVLFVRQAERLVFLYGQLVKRYPMFKVSFRAFFSWDAIDSQFIKKAWHQFAALVFRGKSQ